MKLKKPKFWDYKKPNLLSYFLLPFTLPIIINNFFLKDKKASKISQNIKKICIGNIYVGGTGKTPLTIKMYQILSKLNFKTATIKKFYPQHVDEQEILSQKTKLYCLKDRMESLNKATENDLDVVIFDDGLQDKSVNYDLTFVCFNNIKFIGNGFLIPAGPLREKIEKISRYDAVFINGNKNDNTALKLSIREHDKKIQIFESYYDPVDINKFKTDEKYLIFSGIGNPESFKETLIKNNINVIKEIIFPDHFHYTKKEIDKIKVLAKSLNAKIITTEKDYVKIDNNENKDMEFLTINLKIQDEEKLINYLKLHL
jgi:tetraacyldisaccharide 4'-kinase